MAFYVSNGFSFMIFTLSAFSELSSRKVLNQRAS